MTTDDPIGRHLEARAREIHLPRTDVGAIAERAAARTSRRRKVTFGVTAVAILGAGAVAVTAAGGGDDRTPVATSPEAVVASPLDWTVVDPSVGLGGSRMLNPVATADGSLYSLSTQPGPVAFAGDDAWIARTLYRSADGTEWEQLALPDDIYASSLAADGDRLYAVGTGPTSGDRIPLRLSSSDDAGATWSDPIDLPNLDALTDLGPEVHLGTPSVTAHDGTTLVAVTATAYINVDERLPAGIDAENGYTMTSDGVKVFGESPACAPENAVVMADPSGRRAVDRSGGGCAEPAVIATLTWDQLGVSPELAALTTPQLHLFASTGGGEFAEVPAPVSASGYPVQVVATDDGFTLVAGNPVPLGEVDAVPSAQVFTSPDGTTWTKTADLPDIAVAALGAVDGQAVITGNKSDGQSVVDVLGPTGVEAALDPGDAIGDEPVAQGNFYGFSGFGPLGWATIVYPPVESGTPTLVHSDRTGLLMSAVPVPQELEDWGDPTGMTVTADAIILRYTQTTDGDPTTVEPQRLLVGTPRG